MSGKSEEKAKKRALKTLISVTTPKKISGGLPPLRPPPQKVLFGEENSTSKLDGGGKEFELM